VPNVNWRVVVDPNLYRIRARLKVSISQHKTRLLAEEGLGGGARALCVRMTSQGLRDHRHESCELTRDCDRGGWRDPGTGHNCCKRAALRQHPDAVNTPISGVIHVCALESLLVLLPLTSTRYFRWILSMFRLWLALVYCVSAQPARGTSLARVSSTVIAVWPT
jgi:hypothetical protein